ncbi:hypothetical protein EB796_009258 [Bugula neritina]|uniref:MRPL20 n=1 Tax=Bugula neritina TaxID=10212 RepID=A0A7J7K3C6_BUGNE|nr:hypothetical protein EB796_009258 [Bugula neritina]
MVQLSACLLRKIPGPPRIYKRLQTFRLNARYEGRSRNCYVVGQGYQLKSMQYTRVARKNKVLDFKELYNLRLEAAAEEHGIPFRYLWDGLRRMNILLNRKVLQDIAIYEPRTFAGFCELSKQHQVDQGLNLPPHSYPKIPVNTKGML